MRHLLTAVLGMTLAGTAIAADQAPTVTPSPEPAISGTTSSELDIVNTICPVCGAAADLQREPVSIYDQQNQTWIGVGVDSDAHAALVEKQPERYVQAARSNTLASDASGTSSGMSSSDLSASGTKAGKDASAEEEAALERQDRAGAYEFNQLDSGVTNESSGMNVGKEAMPESADSAYERQGRASALEFNRDEHRDQSDGKMSGSSSGMQPGESSQNKGKSAVRDEYDNDRAGALEFNELEREQGDGE